MTNNLVLDPRQQLATTYYRDPKSSSFGNLYQSMLRAGFSAVYCKNNYNKDVEWIQQAKNTVRSIERAEHNINRINELDIDLEDKSKGNLDLLKIQTGVSMFTLKTLASTKYNDEAKEEKPTVQINIVNYNADTSKDEPIIAQEVGE